jgi:hypothetical protein
MGYLEAVEYIVKRRVRSHKVAGAAWREKEAGRWASFNELCKNGQGPFDTEEAALCYCMGYMHTHFQAAQIPLRGVSRRLAGKSCVAMIDIGCGPMTAALALADLHIKRFGLPLPLNYIGIDIAEPMLELAEEFSERADCFSASPGGYVKLVRRLDDVTDARVRKWLRDSTHVVIVLSYVLAQNAVGHKDVDGYARLVARICTMASDRGVWLAYTNAASLYHNKFQYFVGCCRRYGIEFDRTQRTTENHDFWQHRLNQAAPVFEKSGSDNLEYLAATVSMTK